MLTDWGKRAAELAGMTKREIVTGLCAHHNDLCVPSCLRWTRERLIAAVSRAEAHLYDEDGMLIGEKS